MDFVITHDNGISEEKVDWDQDEEDAKNPADDSDILPDIFNENIINIS